MTDPRIKLTRGGWISLPHPTDATAIEGNFLYRRFSLRDWAHPERDDQRVVQLRGVEADDEHEPDAVTVALGAAELRALGLQLLDAAGQLPLLPAEVRRDLRNALILFVAMVVIGTALRLAAGS